MRRWMRGAGISCIIIIMLMALGYLGLAVYYQNGFTVNTWINGVYCTGRTVHEVNAQLQEQTQMPETLTVIGYDRTGKETVEKSWQISMEELRRSCNYEDALKGYLTEQNGWLWIRDLKTRQAHDLEAVISYDKTVLQTYWDEITARLYAEEDYRIEYGDSVGYLLYDGMHDCLDEEKAYGAIRSAILQGESSVNLIEDECYYDAPLTEQQKRQEELWDKIQLFQENGPYYDFGDGTVQIDRAQMVAFLEKDPQSYLPLTDGAGHFVLVPDSAENWIEEMADLHDTYGKEWDFQNTDGDIVRVPGVTYGTLIDREKESRWLASYLERLAAGQVASGEPGSGTETAVRVPEYLRDAYNRSTQIGDTYIEVNLGTQKLYYYENGERRIETDVVSGNMRRRMGTPEGVNFVYSKQKNRILRGEGYTTPVKFWMPVKDAIGIHDADWRDEFGGDLYKTGGSHGCVNVPPDVMAELFDMVEIGTPVVMFYGEEA